MTSEKNLTQLIIRGITFTYKTMELLAYDMKYYFPKLFPDLKELFHMKLQELYI